MGEQGIRGQDAPLPVPRAALELQAPAGTFGLGHLCSSPPCLTNRVSAAQGVHRYGGCGAGPGGATAKVFFSSLACIVLCSLSHPSFLSAQVANLDVGWTLGYMLNPPNMIPSETPQRVIGLQRSKWIAATVLLANMLILIFCLLTDVYCQKNSGYGSLQQHWLQRLLKPLSPSAMLV